MRLLALIAAAAPACMWARRAPATAAVAERSTIQRGRARSDPCPRALAAGIGCPIRATAYPATGGNRARAPAVLRPAPVHRRPARSCATCHDPAKAFADGRPRSIGRAVLDRNAIALANLRLNRWFGWSGAADSLWAQSIRPILDAKEISMTADELRARLAADPSFAGAYAQIFSTGVAGDPPDRVLVNVAKALAAFQETITTGRTQFDDFRDALERATNQPWRAIRRRQSEGCRFSSARATAAPVISAPTSPAVSSKMSACPILPRRAASTRAGTAGSPHCWRARSTCSALQRRCRQATAVPTRHVEQQHRNWGEFRVPSLRNVALTAPYMHNGSLATPGRRRAPLLRARRGAPARRRGRASRPPAAAVAAGGCRPRCIPADADRRLAVR